MIDLEPRYFRSAPRARVAAAAPSLSRADRRRAACFVTLAAALAAMLVLPSEAPAGWPLAGAAAPALGFGETYAARRRDLIDATAVSTSSAAAGSPVRAPLSGRVSFAGRVPGLGGGTVLAVTIATRERLAHAAAARLDVGHGGRRTWPRGTPLGDLADAGDPSSAGTHLHVGVRKGDLYVDPLAADGAARTVQAGARSRHSRALQRSPNRARPVPRFRRRRGSATSRQRRRVTRGSSPRCEPAPSSAVRPGVAVAGASGVRCRSRRGCRPGGLDPECGGCPGRRAAARCSAVAAAVSAAVDGARQRAMGRGRAGSPSGSCARRERLASGGCPRPCGCLARARRAVADVETRAAERCRSAFGQTRGR